MSITETLFIALFVIYIMLGVVIATILQPSNKWLFISTIVVWPLFAVLVVIILFIGVLYTFGVSIVNRFKED